MACLADYARPWIPLVLGAVVLLVAASAAGLAAIERASKGPAFRLSATCLRLNGPARQQLGVVTGFGFTVQGPVVQNADGTGNARLDFNAIGSWRNGHVHIKAIERHRRWYLTGPAELRVVRRAGAFRIRPTSRVRALDARRYSRLCAPTTSTTTFHGA